MAISPFILSTIAFAPLVGALVVGLGGKCVSRKAAHTITIACVLLSCVLSLYTFNLVLQGAQTNIMLYEWMQVGGVSMQVGFMIDELSVLMMCVVTFVSLMVHIYTIGYMHDDPSYKRFFAYICAFTFAMLMLVMSNNFLQLFFAWEAVGLVSYLLIGFWYTKPTAIYANLKAFIVNRVGDFGFILGIGLLLYASGSLDYAEVFLKNLDMVNKTVPGFDQVSLITLATFCLFIGAMGKSAQFPLHVWLPDSMEGPTPISALIHAATMVTAGIFMVARMSPLFEYAPATLSFILVIGAITALFMGILGIVQNDIKRIVAYSTLSQLGYMTVALGASAYSVAIFHLLTHAFFKALLFLAAGSVIVAMHHEQDIRLMGGLRKYMPITWVTSLIGSLALIGTPFFAGFYSKESIIEAVGHSDLPGAAFAKFAVLAGVVITAFYAFRMYFLVFHGKPRWQGHGAHRTEVSHHDHHTPHESSWVITMPLVLLAIASVLSGFGLIEFLIYGDYFAKAIHVIDEHAAMAMLREHFEGVWAMTLHAFVTLPFWLALSGVVLAFVLYGRTSTLPAILQKRLSWVHQLLEQKYYMDAIHEKVIAPVTRFCGKLLWQIGDRGLIDGLIINGSAKVVGLLASAMRLVQTGSVTAYVLFMSAALIGFIALFAIVR